MASKYVDTMAIMQVIGCIYKFPHLLDQTDKYFFHEEDFTERLELGTKILEFSGFGDKGSKKVEETKN